MDTPAETLLQIHNLSVSYAPANGAPVHAITDLSLDIRSGEILGILGESGCGKSTLAHAVLGLLPPGATTQGQILFRGRDLLRWNDLEFNSIRGREISLIPQNPATSLNPVMRVGSQIGEVLRAHLPLSARDRRLRVNESLHEMGLDRSIYNAYPHQLSGGQRQRIVIAQGLACRPALIIADEPTSKLDARLRTEILGLLSNIRARYGTTIVLITHDLSLLAGVGDRVTVMYAGRVVEVARCAQLFRQPLHPYTQGLVRILQSSGKSITTRQAFPIITGDPPDPAIALHGCEFEPRCSERLQLCARANPREITPEPSRFVRCLKYDA